MEGEGGHARPLDRMILEKGYNLYNVNNLKLARFREIFPDPAKTDSLDVRKILELFHLKDHLPKGESGAVLGDVPFGQAVRTVSRDEEPAAGKPAGQGGGVRCSPAYRACP